MAPGSGVGCPLLRGHVRPFRRVLRARRTVWPTCQARGAPRVMMKGPDAGFRLEAAPEAFSHHLRNGIDFAFAPRFRSPRARVRRGAG